jgi:cytoskeletal protein CcmA (bactofilin family)
MSVEQGRSFIGQDLSIIGDVLGRGAVEIQGQVQGTVSAPNIHVHQGGHVRGAVKADSANVDGTVEGRVAVKNLISIGSRGRVSGDVRYGQLALAEGGDLSADVHNVPPTLGGDFNLVVRRGQRVVVTTLDLTAYDPDSSPDDLVYAVSQPSNGRIVRTNALATPIDRFTQANLAAGQIAFVHDGGPATDASFEVAVVDETGSGSRVPRRVEVNVVDA